MRGAALTRLYRANRRRNLYASGTSGANGTPRDACLGENRRNLEWRDEVV